MPTTVTLHRVIKASPEKLFKAFSDGAAYASWIPPYGFICECHEFDFRLGGRFKMSFINFTTGSKSSFGGAIKALEPNQMVQYSDAFDDPNLSGEMTTTVQLKPVICGTELHIVQEGIPDMIPAEMCYLGWQESLDKLIKLVEPNIPDAQ